MMPHVGRLLNFIFLILLFCLESFGTPAGLTLQGRLVKNDSAVTGAVTLTVQVTSPNSDVCLLYEENHTLNLSAADSGSFSVKIGGGTRTGNDKGLSLVNVFSNTGNAITSLNCSGSSATSYTPASSDSRYVYVTFVSGSDTVTFSSPYVVQSVPYALEAERLSGKTSTEFLQTTTDTTQAKINTIMAATTFTELSALAGGTSTKYMSSSSTAGTTIPSLSSAPSSPAAGQMWFDTGTNNIKYYNGTSTQTLGSTANAVVNGGQSGAVTLGTTDSNPVTVNTNGSARMTVLSTGEVGIGTASPSKPLEVVGEIKSSTIVTAPSIYANAINERTSALNAKINLSSAKTVTINTNNTDRVTVDSSGNVGIGTASPGSPLQVSKTDTSTSGSTYGMQITPTYNQTSSTAANSDLMINRTQTSVGSGSQYLIDTRVNNTTNFWVRNDGVAWVSNVFTTTTMAATNYNGTGNSNNTTVSINNKPLSSAAFGVTMSSGTMSHTSGNFAATQITPIYNQASSTAANTDLLINRTETSVGSGTQRLIDAQVGGTSRFIVSNTGNVGIGVSPSYKLHVVGSSGATVGYFSDGTQTCSITPTTAGNISCSSDERLKQNILSFSDATSLENILKLQTVTYEWKSVANGRHTGYIAQEVEKIAPEFVTTDKEGYKQVSYTGFIPWITGAIKELYSKFVGHDEEIAKLKQENAELKAYLCLKDPTAVFCN